jgi:hypothetical protein
MPNFPPQDYTFTALYVLGNGYYIEFRQNGPEYLAVTKTPEGAVWAEGESSIFSEPKVLVNEAVTILSDQLGIADLQVTRIVEKNPPPAATVPLSFKVMGKVVNEKGDPIKAKATPNIFYNVNGESLPITNLSSVDTNENGDFEILYNGDKVIDFEKSYVEIKSINFFSRTIGPTLTKTGQETITKSLINEEFEGTTTVINVKNLPKEENNFVIEVTLRNEATGEEVTGIGKSIKSDIAQSKARLNAGRKFTEVSSESENIVISIYDLGRIGLEPEVLDLEKEEAEIKMQVQELENIEIAAMGKQELPFEARLAALFNRQKEKLKKTLIPTILSIIAKFGPQIVHNIVSKKINPLADKVCPPKEEILAAIRKRNQLVRQLNNTYKIVRTITRILKITNSVIIGLKVGFAIAKFIPTPPFAPSLLIADGGAEIKKRLEIAGIVVSILTITGVIIGATLAIIIELLNSLDFLIQDCSEAIDPETGAPIIPFVTINDELNTFIDASTGEPDGISNPLNPDQPLPYKGFTFEIKQDISQNFQYPKRYAIARNIQGIQVLRSESSFASSPQILIEELKFVIDRDNLRAD